MIPGNIRPAKLVLLAIINSDLVGILVINPLMDLDLHTHFMKGEKIGQLLEMFESPLNFIFLKIVI